MDAHTSSHTHQSERFHDQFLKELSSQATYILCFVYEWKGWILKHLFAETIGRWALITNWPKSPCSGLKEFSWPEIDTLNNKEMCSWQVYWTRKFISPIHLGKTCLLFCNMKRLNEIISKVPSNYKILLLKLHHETGQHSYPLMGIYPTEFTIKYNSNYESLRRIQF